MTPSIDDAKSMARRLRAALDPRGLAASHSDALELVAAQLGFRDWNTAHAALGSDEAGAARFVHAIPVMLSLDEAKSRAFYRDFLGFEIAFEHRFAPDMPAYIAFRRGPVELHLSPHRGDAASRSAIFVWMTGLEDYRRELETRSEGHAIPAAVDQEWGRELGVTDPFGNRLRFCERPRDGRPAPAGPNPGDATSAEKSGGAFALVREIGADLPGVKVTSDSTGTALKMGGTILACSAIHKSAEPNSLMVRLGFDRRNTLVEERPDTFYLSRHYEPYPVVLIRLSKSDRNDLATLLREARDFVSRERSE